MHPSSHIHSAIARDIESRRIAAAGASRAARAARRRAATAAEASPRATHPAVRWLPALRRRVDAAPERHAL